NVGPDHFHVHATEYTDAEENTCSVVSQDRIVEDFLTTHALYRKQVCTICGSLLKSFHKDAVLVSSELEIVTVFTDITYCVAECAFYTVLIVVLFHNGLLSMCNSSSPLRVV